MSDLLNADSETSKERLLTAICLIMLLEHKKLGLEEVIRATGMSFSEVRSALQNLVNLRLVSVYPTKTGMPHFQLISELDAKNYLEIIGVNQAS